MPDSHSQPRLIVGIGIDPGNSQSLTFAILFSDGDKNHLTTIVDPVQAYLFASSHNPCFCSGCRTPFCLGEYASIAFPISPDFQAGSSGLCGKLCE